MKYFSRILAVCIASVISVFWLTYIDQITYINVLPIFFLISLSWFIGRWFDENIFNRDLKISKKKIYKCIDNVEVCIIKLDKDLNATYVSKPIEKIYGISPKKLIQNRSLWKEVIVSDDVDQVNFELEKLKEGQSVHIQYRITNRANDEIKWVENRLTPIFNDKEKLIEFAGVILDITEQKQKEENVRQLAYYDNLTGLPNRASFNHTFQTSLANCKKHSQNLALLFLDLDKFKLINDKYGHSAGDEILIQVGERLLKSVRKLDTVSRQGGDEFIILLDHVEKTEVERIAERIVQQFTSPFIVEENSISLSISIGISMYPTDGKDTELLMKRADEAMYQAKKLGNNNFEFYSEVENCQIEKRRSDQQSEGNLNKKRDFKLYTSSNIEKCL